MNTKEIVEQTGVTMDNVYACYERDIERFVKLVRADEREACAKLCDDLAGQVGNKNFIAVDQRQFCAKQIRARGEK
jgi:hypothetical protein